MSKTRSETKLDENPSERKNAISICDIMKDNTTATIRKIESQLPTYVQLYSDLYIEYLHSLDNVFGTCYISQKEFFDKMGFDQKILANLKEYWDAITSTFLTQIEMSTNFQSFYIKTRIEAIKSFNKYAQLSMENYTRILSQFNKFSST
jgi:hypothetical protein